MLLGINKEFSCLFFRLRKSVCKTNSFEHHQSQMETNKEINLADPTYTIQHLQLLFKRGRTSTWKIVKQLGFPSPTDLGGVNGKYVWTRIVILDWLAGRPEYAGVKSSRKNPKRRSNRSVHKFLERV